VTPQGIALVSAVLAYLFAKPGKRSRIAEHLFNLLLLCMCSCEEAFTVSEAPLSSDCLKLCVGPGVLAGAIDYYILDKFQRLTNTKTYTKVCTLLLSYHNSCASFLNAQNVL